MGLEAEDRPLEVQAPGLSTHWGSSEHLPQDPQGPSPRQPSPSQRPAVLSARSQVALGPPRQGPLPPTRPSAPTPPTRDPQLPREGVGPLIT